MRPQRNIEPKLKTGFKTNVTHLFLMEPYACGSNLVDTDPYDTYTLAGTDGEVERSTTFRTRVDLHPFGSAEHFDRALLRMMLSVAKHLHRFTVVTPKHFHRFLIGEKFVFAGLKARELFRQSELVKYSAGDFGWDAPGLPSNIALAVDLEHPELFGRIVFDGHDEYGAVLFAPRIISAVEIVPTPWGFPGQESKPERLPPLD